MTWHRGSAVQVWLARVLAIAFVVSCGLTVVGSAGGTDGHAPVLGSGARSMPWPPVVAGAVGVADAVSGSVAANGSPTLQRPNADTATWLLLPRHAACGLTSVWVPAVNGALARSSAFSRAPPLA